MKRIVVVGLLVMSTGVAVVCAQEKPAAPVAPAVQPAAAAVQPVADPAAPAAPAVKAVVHEPPPAQMKAGLQQQINTLEREARKNDPTLNAKLDDLENQRRQVFIQAKPELEALYAQQDAVQEKTKAVGGKHGGPGGKMRPGGEARAEKRAERATQKAEKAAPKAEQK